jgi:1,4-alpha-glucan branching enzyme
MINIGKAQNAASQTDRLAGPVSVYEVHPGSWMRVPEEKGRPLTATELAPKLAVYARRMNFTHVELLCSPPTPTCSEPEDLLHIVKQLRKHGLKVMLDHPPSPAPVIESGLPASLLEEFIDVNFPGHIGAVEAGATAGADSELLSKREVALMCDVPDCLAREPILQKILQQATAHCANAFPDNYILSSSHEEVSAGRPSLITRMPGDEWQKFANLRLLFGNMYAQPGSKFVFMGDEFGQWNEWNPGASLDWHLVKDGSRHRGLQNWVAELNRFYRREPALYQTGTNPDGFEWVDPSNAEPSIVRWLRKSPVSGETILAVFNFSSVPCENYLVGVPLGGFWKEVLNSDAPEYGGGGGNLGGVEASPPGWHLKTRSLTVAVPPLGAVFFKQTNQG